MSLVNVMLARAASRCPPSSRPRLTAPPRDFSSRARAASMNCGNSRMMTGTPAIEADSAMPAPMNPPPRMATDSIVCDTFPAPPSPSDDDACSRVRFFSPVLGCRARYLFPEPVHGFLAAFIDVRGQSPFGQMLAELEPH